MSFQSELLQLLADFDLLNVFDFDALTSERKHYLVTRLYKCFERGLSHVSEELSEIEGLKVSYERSPHEKQSLFEDNTLKNLAFYSSHAVVTCPIEEVGGRLKLSKNKRLPGRERLGSVALRQLRQEGSYVFGDVKAHQRGHGGEVHIEGKAYVVERSAITKLIDTVVGLRSALEAGLVHVLPALPDAKHKLRSDLRRARVVSGNFTRQTLVQQLAEAPDGRQALFDTGMTRIYLPHVTNVSLAEIVDIRGAERDAYDEFQAALSDYVFTTAGSFSEQKLEEYLKRVDEALRVIRAHLARLQRQYDARSRNMLIQYLTLGLVALAPHDYAAVLTPIISGLSAFNFLKTRSEHIESRQNAAAGEFYVAWRLDEVSQKRGA